MLSRAECESPDMVSSIRSVGRMVPDALFFIAVHGLTTTYTKQQYAFS
jgi:hypothetical protein